MCWVHRSFLWQLWNLSSIIFTQLDSTILTFVSLRNDFGKVANHSEIPDQFQTYQPLSKVLNGLTWLDPFQSSHGHHKIPIFRAYPAPGERKKSMALGTWRERDNGHVPTELSKPRAPGRSIQIPSGMITERPKSFRSSTFIKALIKPTVISQSSEYIPPAWYTTATQPVWTNIKSHASMLNQTMQFWGRLIRLISYKKKCQLLGWKLAPSFCSRNPWIGNSHVSPLYSNHQWNILASPSYSYFHQQESNPLHSKRPNHLATHYSHY